MSMIPKLNPDVRTLLTQEMGESSLLLRDLKGYFLNGDVDRLNVIINRNYNIAISRHVKIDEAIESAFGLYLILKSGILYLPTRKSEFNVKSTALIDMFSDLCVYYGTQICRVPYEFLRIYEGHYCDSLYRLFAFGYDDRTEMLYQQALKENPEVDRGKILRRNVDDQEAVFLEASLRSRVDGDSTCEVRSASVQQLSTNPLGAFKYKADTKESNQIKIHRMYSLREELKRQGYSEAANILYKSIMSMKENDPGLTPKRFDRFVLFVWGSLTDYGTSLLGLVTVFAWMFVITFSIIFIDLTCILITERRKLMLWRNIWKLVSNTLYENLLLFSLSGSERWSNSKYKIVYAFLRFFVSCLSAIGFGIIVAYFYGLS